VSPVRALALVAVPGMLGLAATGCGGGSGSPAVASLGTKTASGSTTTAAGPSPRSSEALVTCLRAHGVQAALGSGANGNGPVVTIGGVVITGVNPASPQLQSALQACRKFLPGGGPPALTPAQEAAAAKAMRRFAACMRSHGVSKFPDPNGQGFFPPDSLQAIDPRSPSARRAFRACQSLESKNGPHLQLP
jgi:hypothetical protein